jgi:hypothetical protein
MIHRQAINHPPSHKRQVIDTILHQAVVLNQRQPRLRQRRQIAVGIIQIIEGAELNGAALWKS